MTDRSAFAPTVIDRALERIQRAAPTLGRVSQAVLVLAATCFALLDLWFVLAVWENRGADAPLRAGTAVVAAIAVVAVALRRRWLHPSMTVLGVASIVATASVVSTGSQALPSLAALFAFALLTINVLRSSPGRIAVGLAALATVGVASEAVRINESLAASALIVCEAAFAVAVAAGVYLRWTDWRRHVGESAARTDERLEIARELHDLVGHYVTGIVVQAQAARHVAADHPEAALEALGRIESAGSDAMSAMRRMVGGLRDDSPIVPGAAWDDLEAVVATTRRDGLPVRLRLDDEARSGSADLSASAYRIVTEALTNVRRHARDVTQVDVEIGVDAGRLLVVVADDGAGAARVGAGTYGLVGMRERAEALGGTLYAGPRPSGGWLVRADVPLVGAS